MLPEGKSIFLDNLSFILNEEKYGDCISWSEDGKSFTIHNLNKFTEKVLPDFFKHKNFSSFHRQLNLYGFTRDKKSKLEKTFVNPFFSRNRPDLLDHIKKKVPVPEQLPVLDSKQSDDSRCLVLRKSLKNKNKDIEGRLGLVEKALEGMEVIQNRLIRECQESNHGIEQAHRIIMYFAEWIKKNPSCMEFFKIPEKPKPRKNSEVEEIEDNQWPERVIYDDIIQF